MEQSVVHVKNVQKIFGKKSETNFKALDDVSFDIYPGGICWNHGLQELGRRLY